MMRLKLLMLIVGGVFALLFLHGSSCLHVERSYHPPTPQEVVAAVRARGLQIARIRAETRMSQRTSQGKIKATVRLMAERGGKLRYDAVSPFDTPLITLVSDGTNFSLIDGRKNRFYHGPSSPCNIARFLQVILQPDDILNILGGSTPIIAHHRASLAWDDRAGAEVLTLQGKDLTQIIRLDGHRRTWDLLFSEVKNHRGERLLRIETGEFHQAGSLRLPKTIKVSQPKFQTDLEVTFKLQEVNIALPEDAFRLLSPSGLPSQKVDCSTEIQF